MVTTEGDLNGGGTRRQPTGRQTDSRRGQMPVPELYWKLQGRDGEEGKPGQKDEARAGPIGHPRSDHLRGASACSGCHAQLWGLHTAQLHVHHPQPAVPIILDSLSSTRRHA